MSHENLRNMNPDEIREDQVEALLKLINARLEVVEHDPLLRDYYEAVILIPDPDNPEGGVLGVDISRVSFVGNGTTRIEAVRSAWKQCLDFVRQNSGPEWAAFLGEALWHEAK